MNTSRSRYHRTAMAIAVGLAIVALAGCQGMMRGMGMVPMGSSGDVSDAEQLWSALQQANLIGPNGVRSTPYTGQHPHGAVLETVHKNITLDGHTGIAIVKRNYGGPGVSIDNVSRDRSKYLKTITVMYQRESGYDSDNENWFWAKYMPDGSLAVKYKMGMKIRLAGRVAKGKSEGCIACHHGAPGGDYVFASDITVL